MATLEMLEKVKGAMLITGDYQDKALSLWIDEATAFLSDAGVTMDVLSSDDAVGVITRGVIDLWNYGAGSGKLSQHFLQRAVQLVYKKVMWDGV